MQKNVKNANTFFLTGIRNRLLTRNLVVRGSTQKKQVYERLQNVLVSTPKRISEWRDKSDKISTQDPKRLRLEGESRPMLHGNVEERLLQWIFDRRSRMLRVSWQNDHVQS